MSKGGPITLKGLIGQGRSSKRDEDGLVPALESQPMHEQRTSCLGIITPPTIRTLCDSLPRHQYNSRYQLETHLSTKLHLFSTISLGVNFPGTEPKQAYTLSQQTTKMPTRSVAVAAIFFCK